VAGFAPPAGRGFPRPARGPAATGSGDPRDPDHLATDLARVARTADQAGFEYVAVMDHFFQIGVIGPPEREMLKAYRTLGYLAAHTAQANLLVLITGTIYRHPGILAKTVTTLDVLSGGRAWLGIGAAWNEAESLGLGVPFPPVAERFERLEETLQICLQMWAGNEQPYEGRHYALQRPLNSPQSLSRPHPPIMVGGGGVRKTLRLVAKYANACNLFPSRKLPHKLQVLREHCERGGRDHDEIRRTVYHRFDVGPNGEHVGRILDELRHFADLGIQAAIGQVVDVYGIEPLEIIGEQVIPVVADF
jgi:F420-dependent oxidoreductase-like protein